MINKDKISRVLIYDLQDRLLVTTSEIIFPKDFFKIRGQDLVMLKGADFPIISKGEYINVIFEYITGTRIKYRTAVDLCTEYQINFHVGEGVVLEERRRSFKINVSINGISSFYLRNDEMFSFDPPINVSFVNLNLGGAYIRCDFDFEVGDRLMLCFLDGKVELMCDVLRVQKKESGLVDGYGCRFVDISHQQEALITRFIFDCQLAERERLKNEKNKHL